MAVPTEPRGTFPLNDGRAMPAIGLGTFRSEAEQTVRSVVWALQAGYRHIDTAEMYGNEAAVGEGLRRGRVPREEIFVTTKLAPRGRDYQGTLTASQASLQALGLEYVDLYLIHAPMDKANRLEQWRALETLQEQGKAQSIGVSNYGVHHLEELLGVCKVKPAVNQLEITPYLQRQQLISLCREHGILPVAYSPLTKGWKLEDPPLVALAERKGVSAAQVLIRWGLQMGVPQLMKSSKRERVAENANVFGFSLDGDDMAALEALEEHLVTGWDPTEGP